MDGFVIVVVCVVAAVVAIPVLGVMIILGLGERDPYDERDCRATVDRSNSLSEARDDD